ncbi:hypothetical protein CFC21_028535 [Triticum aestivum]|uniref:Peroxidase n=2 Tax=Triticum aestivum TaxID=4565 RepID=A0A3B6DBY3_WHEAT|nr:hypothetical protein CFC21_028535 [Triticum aestivum]
MPGQGAPGHRVRVGYYNRKCPAAEIIVRAVVGKAVSRNPGLGAGIIRMAFHDCFVQGCEASVLLDPTPANPRPEKLGPPNFPSLRGFEVIDAAKAVLERVCPGVVSCADVIAFAARDSAYFLSGYKIDYKMPAGRFDGSVSLESESLQFLPPPFFNLTQLVDSFKAKNMNEDDLSKCPVSPNFTNDPTVVQDIVTPNRMDNKYYTNLLKRNVLFTSDAALLTSGKTALKVMENAFKPGSWEKKFAKAMVKMAAIELKTAANGEIRRNCRVVNN